MIYKNILYDADIFSLQKNGGIRTYFSNLIKDEKLFNGINQKYVNLKPFSKKIKLENIYSIFLLLNSFLKPIFRNKGFDIYHATYIRNPFFKYVNILKVITVHDMIHELHPMFFESKYRKKIGTYVRFKKNCIYNADSIITVSYSTKNDLLKVYPDLEYKIPISVIPHGGDHFNDFPYENLNYPEKEFRFLYVGARNNYKGFNDLIDALKLLSKKKINFKLICVGSELTNKEKALIKSLHLSKYVECIQPSNLELSNIMRNCSLFIYPSWYEGFGIPILESLNMGLPVICSDIPSSIEVGKEYVNYFKNKSPYSLYRKILEFTEKPNKFLEKTISAKEFLKTMTWSRNIELTIKLYDELIRNKKFSI